MQENCRATPSLQGQINDDANGIVTVLNLEDFLEAVSKWADDRDDVVGVALVGSHARNAARPDSDIDLAVLCADPRALTVDHGWLAHFGEIRKAGTERYGPVTSLRVFYKDGFEVEYGIVQPSWVGIPLDSGTRRVISDGMRIVYDPDGLFAVARRAASGPQPPNAEPEPDIHG